jgi:DNA excision repair protein ERCC-4
VEDQRYRSALRIEREAFQSLILEKSRMVVSDEWDAPPPVPRLPGEASGSSGGDGTLGGNASSRRAGGRAAAAAAGPPTVIVDVREFRSALPNMLHLHGMVVKPITLEVGDYILSADVCVERKAVPDLIQSLAHGRLFHQAEAMLRYYKRPALLIECDEARPFGLINQTELGTEILPNHLLSKLCLLLLHFPKLRLLWSRSPAHTVAIFAALKQGQSEPDAATAAAVGAAHAPGADQAFNMAPQDFLRQLPGVHAHNYRKLMNSVPNLQELAGRTQEQLSAIIGAQNGRLLHAFLHREV